MSVTSCLLVHFNAKSPIAAYRAEMASDVQELVADGMAQEAAWLQVADAKLADLSAERTRIEQSVADAYAKTAAGKPVEDPAGKGGVQSAPTPAASDQQVTAPKRTETRGKAKHPKTIMGSRILAIVSKNLDGLDPAWIAEFSHRQATKARDKNGNPRIEWRNPLIPGIGRLFRRGGTQDLQLLAEALEETGYLPAGSVEADTKEAGETAKQIVRDALNRAEAQTQDEIMAERQAEYDRRGQEETDDYAGLDPESAAEAESERAAIIAESNIDAERLDATADDDIPFDTPGLSGAAGMRSSGMFSEQEIEDVEQQEREALQQGRTGGQTRQDGPEAAREVAQAGTAQAQPAGDGEGLTLSAQTPEDLKTKAGREAAGEEAERAKKAADQARLRKEAEARDNKARADQSVDDFQLGQSADQQMSGMGDMFADAPTAQEAAPATPESATPSAAEKAAPGKLDNFGEALPPSRRQQAAAMDKTLSDDDIANRPLSEIWPLAENEAIQETFPAAVAHAARAEVPAKPRKGYKLDRWVQGVKTVRNLAKLVISGGITPEQFKEKAGNALEGFVSKVALLTAIDRAQWKRIGAVREMPKASRFVEGEPVIQPMVAVEVDGKNHWLAGSGSIADHLDKINELLGTEVQDKKMAFEVRGSGNRFFINKKGDSEYRHLMDFSNAGDAIKARSEKYVDLVKAWDAVKARDNVTEADTRSDANADRVGKDWRDGKDISGEDFDKQFKFKGGEFGKWVSQGDGAKERQWMLNRAYDALMDLAELINIPPQAISLNGTMGVAFGSRGSGKASAHFEPGNLVINLTKTNGAGALAHEWFHALDNYFARMRGGEIPMSVVKTADGYRKANFVTYKPEPLMVPKAGVAGGRYLPPMTKGKLDAMREARKHLTDTYNPERWEVDPKHPAGIRPEVEERFADLVTALNEAPMTKRASMIDKGKSEGYWSQIIERGARSFESYVIARLAERGQRNDYLANVTPIDTFVRDKGRYPYPTPAEIKPVAEAFDALFETIQTRTDDAGNVAMFSRAPAVRTALDSAIEAKAAFDTMDRASEKVADADAYFALSEKSSEARTKLADELDAQPDDGFVLQGRGFGGRMVMLNASAQQPGQWQITRFDDNDAPLGDGQYTTKAKALETFLREIDLASLQDFEGTFSRADTPGTKSDISRVTNTAEAIASLWGNKPDIVVFGDMQDDSVPASVRARDAQQRSQGASGEPRAFYAGGKVYLHAGMLKNPRDVAEALYHEALGHAGLRGHFGPKLDRVLDQMAALYNQATLQDKAIEYGQAITDKNGEFVRYISEQAKRTTAEEVLAELAQSKPESMFVQRAIAAIRTWLREHVSGFADMKMTDAEVIRNFIAPARGFIERGAADMRGGDAVFQRVWHGTPHRGIEKFSTDAIGTGEGAQVYGWGLYFTSKKEIGEHYREKLAGETVARAEVEEYTIAGDRNWIVTTLNEAEDQLGRSGYLDDTEMRAVLGDKAAGEVLKKSDANPGGADGRYEVGATPGQLYEVEVPEDSELLDWDRPLNEQSAVVQEAFPPGFTDASRALAQDARNLKKQAEAMDDISAIELTKKARALEHRRLFGLQSKTGTGGDFYKALSGRLADSSGERSDKKASNALAALGIRGIKYLDGTSRDGKGNGHNYVIFNGDDAAITGTMFSRAPATDSAAFRNWFGDSKVVDKDGAPLVVYHGTSSDFMEFSPAFTRDIGFHFGTSAQAGRFGNIVMPVYLNIKNPLRVEDRFSRQGEMSAFSEDIHYETDITSAESDRLLELAREVDQKWDDGRDADNTMIAEAKEFWALAQRVIQRSGFDGLVYKNDVEGIGDSYVVFHPEQIKSATGNSGAFEPASPEIRFSRATLAGAVDRLRNAGGGPTITGDTGRTYTDEQRRAMRNVGFEVEAPTLEARVKSMWQDAGKKLAQGLFDQFAPVKEISKDAYALLRLSKGASGAFETLLAGGRLKLTDGTYDYDDANKGGVVDRLLKPLQGEHHDFLRWVAAFRAARLKADGKENLFSTEDILGLKTLADGATSFDYEIKHGASAGTTTRDRTMIYADSLKTFNEFNKNVLDMAEESGLIDGEARSIWEHEFYVPFYRVAEEGGVSGANVKSGVVRQQAFKALKGGKQALNADLLDNTLNNWAHLLDASAKNRAAKATLEAAERVGAAVPAPEATAREMANSIGKKDGVVWFMDGGVKRFYLLEDPHLLAALSALEYAGMNSPIMKAMGLFKHVLTVGVTASPFFKIRNLIRDSVQAIGSGPLNYNPVTNVAEGWKLTDPKSDSYFRLLAGGGTIHFGTMMEGSEAKRVQALVESGVDSSTILNSDAKVKAFYRKFIEPGITAYNELGNRGEAVNRASLYAQLRKQGMNHAEASLQARDLMDFSMQGTFTSIRFLSQVVPFFNARIQGIYKLGRAMKEDPKRMGIVIGATAVMSLGLMAAFSDDDDWKKREDWDRNNYWWFKVGGTAFRIPKPFEIGAIATLAERGFELAFDKEMTGKRFRQQVMTLLGDNLSMNPIPQLVKPMLDVYANKDSFTGRPIETLSMERIASEYRFTDRSSMAARGVSTAMNAATGLVGKESLSPVQVDHLLRGYFGWLGAFIVGASDVIARPATGQSDRPDSDLWKAATGGMASDLRDAPSRYVSQMYEQAKEIEQAYGTWKMLVKEGKTEEAAEYRQGKAEEIGKHHTALRAKLEASKINQQIRSIERGDMPGAEKRDRIRLLQERKDRLARPLSAVN